MGGIRKNSKRIAVYITEKNVHIIAGAIAILSIVVRWYDPYKITLIDISSRHRHIDIVGTAAISSHIVFAALDLATPVVGVLCCCFIDLAVFV